MLNNKSEQALKNLKRVARFNGRSEEGEKIDMNVRKEARGFFHFCVSRLSFFFFPLNFEMMEVFDSSVNRFCRSP